MSLIVIVARTKMGENGCCVGGLDLDANRSVRLLTSSGMHLSAEAVFRVGEVREIKYQKQSEGNLIPPHVEDVLMQSVGKVKYQVGNMTNLLMRKAEIWRGGTESLFSGRLLSTSSGSGFINRTNGIPDRSTGFWISDRDLVLVEYDSGCYYRYPSSGKNRKIKYVGFDEPRRVLSKGTLLRVSLARWWTSNHDPEAESRCYLQLSGWYEQ